MNAYKKLIIGTTVGLLVIASCLLTYQGKKINELQRNLEIKQQIDERQSAKSYSVLNTKTIEEEFNKLGSYSVLKNSKISMTHNYEYQEDAWLGLKRKAVLKGTGNLVYSYDISLKSADIKLDVEHNTITISIDEPYLDEESVHLEQDSLIIDSDYNWLCRTEEGKKTTQYFIDDFVEDGINNLTEYYNTENNRKRLENSAICEVKELVQTLNLYDCTVIVKIKK